MSGLGDDVKEGQAFSIDEEARKEDELFSRDFDSEKQISKYLSKEFGDHVELLKIKEEKWANWIFATAGLLIIIMFLFAPIFFACTFLKPEGMSEDWYLISFFATKITLSLVALTMFFWFIKLYSNTRRLKVVYKDKQIVAETLYRFLKTDIFGSSRSLLIERASNLLFESTLLQSENKQEDKTEYLEVIKLLLSRKE